MRSLKTSLLSMLIALSFTASLAHAEGETKAPGTSIKAGDSKEARSDVSDEGYTDKANKLKGSVESVMGLAEAAAAGGPDFASLKNLSQATSFYSNLHGTCVKSQSTASWLCREKTSPELQKTLNNINTVASMITGVAVQDACSNLAKIARLAQGGLTAYTAACSTARAACEASCSTVSNNLERIVKMQVTAYGCGHAGPIPPAAAGTCKSLGDALLNLDKEIQDLAGTDNSKADSKSIAKKNVACTYEYANMIVSAGAGIASMISSFKQGQQCDEESNGTGTDTTTTAAVDKCADATVAANDPECICKANPRTPGCSNSYQKANDGSASRLTSQGAELGTANGAGTNTLPGIESDPLAGLRDLASTNAGGSDSSGIGAPMGGGSGLSGFGGGSGGGAGAQGEAAKKGLNTDILSGSGGGGGGGGFGGFKGSDPKLRQYLPGGAKDPSQGMAGQQAWKNEVTGQGGKSNWEKIRERYRDNKNTLLNN